MTPAAILDALRVGGFAVRIVGGDSLAVTPASSLPSEVRELLRANKAGMLELLRQAHETTTALIEAAMLACDHHGDDERAREQMRADCIATPPQIRADLLAHFNTTCLKETHHENNQPKSVPE